LRQPSDINCFLCTKEGIPAEKLGECLPGTDVDRFPCMADTPGRRKRKWKCQGCRDAGRAVEI